MFSLCCKAIWAEFFGIKSDIQIKFIIIIIGTINLVKNSPLNSQSTIHLGVHMNLFDMKTRVLPSPGQLEALNTLLSRIIWWWLCLWFTCWAWYLPVTWWSLWSLLHEEDLEMVQLPLSQPSWAQEAYTIYPLPLFTTVFTQQNDLFKALVYKGDPASCLLPPAASRMTANIFYC